jgi:hypothetical protein
MPMESTKPPPTKGRPATTPLDDGPTTHQPDTTTSSGQSTERRFDKFGWLRTVYATPEFKDGEKAVLAFVAVFSVMTGCTTFCVRQETLAEHCGVSKSTVNRALRRGKNLGYLAVSRRRKSGSGCHGADELRLALPKSHVKLTTDSEKSDVKLTTNSGQSHVQLTTDSAKSHVNLTSEHIEERTRQVFKENSSLKEAGAASTVRPAPESQRPPPICSKHPDGPDHDEPCRACKRWREWREQEQARTAESQRQEPRARSAVRDACCLCDEAGWLLGDDGGATNRKCTHEGKSRRTA